MFAPDDSSTYDLPPEPSYDLPLWNEHSRGRLQGVQNKKDAVAKFLAGQKKVFDKHVWNLYGQPDIRDAVDAFGRDTFILIGLETDVCVAQSALGLQAGGYNVVVVDDATGSPPPHHEAGVRRLRDAQITLQTTKGVYYELVRDIPTSHRVMTHIKTNYSYPTLGCATDYTI